MFSLIFLWISEKYGDWLEESNENGTDSCKNETVLDNSDEECSKKSKVKTGEDKLKGESSENSDEMEIRRRKLKIKRSKLKRKGLKENLEF